jgi:hypothetical protein
VSATAGAWGGVVVRIVPGSSEGCWSCLEHHRADDSVPAPPADPTGLIQPHGCAEPTFTGRAVELDLIALHATRLTLSTLTNAAQGTTTSLGADINVAAHRTSQGLECTTRWSELALRRHPACPLHENEKD